MTSTIDTRRTVDRRELHFRSSEDILADLDGILASPNVRTTGNWTEGEIFDHVAKLIRFSYDGFPFSAPLPIRIAGRVARRWLLSRPMPRGLKLRGGSEALLPEPGVSREEGAERLRTQLERISSGEPMTATSPFAGALTHDQWHTIHLRHAELHMGFIMPGSADRPDTTA